MGLHVGFDGPRIYLEIAMAAALVYFIVKASKP
jgi:hypothetical protein